MAIENIKKVLIVGAGTMGLRIGLQAAISGYDVVIYDIYEAVFEKAKTIQKKLLGQEQKLGRLNEDFDIIKARIKWTTDLKLACQNVDIVSESIIEEIEPKKQVWAEIGKYCPKHTIFTTNTSYFLPSMFAEFSGRPELFCAFHFHDVFLANVVDVMPHAGTAKWITPLLKEFGKTLRQIPVVVEKESSGYIFNVMLIALLGSAGGLLTSGVASPEDIDRSFMGNFKIPRGPFAILDDIGLDTAWHVIHNLKDTKSQRFAALLKTYVDQGKLGKKSGEGFYTYPNPAFKQAEFLKT